MMPYRVSAIVSVYDSDLHIKGCLEDLCAQTLYARGELEIVLVNTASPGNEDAYIEKFRRSHPHIVYVKTDLREGVYGAWNRGIAASSAAYLTNANTDDRHRCDALEVLADALDARPDAGLAYADIFVTNYPNQTFDHCIRCGYQIKPAYDPSIMLRECYMGPQPMWRRSVHDAIGCFDASYVAAGDYEMWLRIARRFPMLHVPQLLGIYFENPCGCVNTRISATLAETELIKKKYAADFPAPSAWENRHFQFTGSVGLDGHVNVCVIVPDLDGETRRIFETLLDTTEYPHVVTAVNNGGGSETAAYLQSLKMLGLVTHIVTFRHPVSRDVAEAAARACEPSSHYFVVCDSVSQVAVAGWLSAHVFSCVTKSAFFCAHMAAADESERAAQQQWCAQSLSDAAAMYGLRLCNIRYPDERRVLPLGWDDAPVLMRSAHETIAAGTKRKPFAKDVFDAACEKASRGGATFFAVLSDDVAVTRKLLDRISGLLTQGFECIAVSRTECVINGACVRSAGVDHFSFDCFVISTAAWQREHRRFRDYVFGEPTWDKAWAAILMTHTVGAVLWEHGLLLHHRRETPLQSGAYGDHNLRLLAHDDAVYGERFTRFCRKAQARGLGLADRFDAAELIRDVFRRPLPAGGAAGEDALRILLVAHNFPPQWHGGVEVYTAAFAAALAAQGHHVSVLYPVGVATDAAAQIVSSPREGYTVCEFRHRSDPIDPFFLCDEAFDRVFSAFLKEERFDVVHFEHLMRLPFSFVEIAARCGGAVCMTLHDFWFICPRIYLQSPCCGPQTPADCTVCYLSDRRAAATPAAEAAILSLTTKRQQYAKVLLADCVDTLTAPSAFVAEVYRSAGFAAEAIEVSALGLSAFGLVARENGRRPLTFGFLGSVSPVKNVPLLLSAFMKTRGDACLLLRGTANDEAKAMLAHASQQDARITYGGAYLPSELGAVLAAIDVLVLPSLQESYSLVIREAFFAGVPVIAARVGAIPEIVVNMENGMLFDSCDEGALLRCLETIIAEPSLIKRFVLNIPRVKTIAQDAAEWIKRYRAAIAGKRRAVPSSEFVGFDFSAEIGQDAHRLAALGRVRQHYAAGRFAFAEKILFSEFGETPRMKDVCARMRNTPAVGAEAEHA